MKKLSILFSDILDDVAEKPAEMITYAREQMDKVREVLQDMPGYNCPTACNLCCHGSILMSYVEYVSILSRLQERYGREKMGEIYAERLGVLEDEGKLLCPFVNDDRMAEHCGIYQERPLICRVYGTTASPCDEDIVPPPFAEELFFQAYHMLYYVEDGSFIGLPLNDELALFEAPFDVWAIADSGRLAELQNIFLEHGSMRAVICDVPQNRFFTMLPGGERLYLEE
jgi:Fe-S-cluster containining protein